MTQKISKNMMGTLGTFTGGIVPSNSTVDTTVQLLINAVNAKEPVIPAGTSGQYLRGDKTLGVLSKTLVGLSNVDNTSDANKPISSATQTALNGKEPSLPSGGNNAHYLRGDKTWATLGKVSVGLSEVDNTSDMNKPVSTAQAAAISALGLTLQPVNTNLTAISALSTTSFGRSFLTQLDAPASRALLGLSTSVTYDVGTLGQRIPLLNGNNSWSGAQTFTSQIVSDSANATSIVLSRNNSSTNIAAEFKTTVGSIFIGNKNGSTFAVKSNNNFSTANWMEVTPTMTSVNGLSTANAQITGGSITGITDLAITDGGTGSSTVFGAKANLGLELVDNTSDLNKPISTATQSALDLKASVAAATTTVNGLMSFSDKVKLNGIATGATANATDALLRDRSTHTGTQSVDTIVESTAFKIMTAAERAKLSGIEAGATANSTDANLRDRSTHTGSQDISTIVNLQSTLDGKESITNRGVANGYAILGSDGKIPSINLPDNGSYKGNWNASTNTPTVVAGTGTNGDTYTVSVAGTQSVTGTSTAFAIGDQLKFTTNGNKWERIPNYQSVSSVAGLTGPIISSDLKTALVLTKTDVGLSNVDNTSDVNKPISTAVQTALNSKASTAVVTTSVNGLLAFTDKVKLDGIAAGATANATDSALRDRATHTGSQAISTVTGLQAALDAKEATLASGTTAQYYRGDKSWQTLNAAAVGLANVDNTADINKPVSTAQQAALNTKQATLVSGTSIKTVGGISLLGSGDVGTLGLEYGGTGSTTAAGARSSLGLGTAATVNTGTSGSVVPMLSNSLTTWSGNKTLSAIGAGVTTRAMIIDVDSGATAGYYFRTGGLDRWRLTKNNTTEDGSGGGSDLTIIRCNDAGISQGAALSISRSTGVVTLSAALPLSSGGTGATTVSAAKINLLLNNVDNTSDLNKPISTLTQAALDTKATPAYVKDLLSSRSANILDIASVDLNGNNDMASAYQNLINQAATAGVPVFAPACKILLGSTIDLPQGHMFYGHSSGSETGLSNPRSSSSFLIAHSGKGFICSGANPGGSSNINIFDQCTHRIQPAVVSGQPWAPSDHDYDYYFDYINDLRMSRLLTVNATRGIYVNGGRNTIEDWSGQCFKKGLHVDCSYDTFILSRTHLWPFKSQADEVRAYMQANLTALRLNRVDNPFISQLFSIWHNRGIHIGWFPGDGPFKPAGTVSKLKLIGADIDIGDTAYYVDETADGHTATFASFTAQGKNTPTGQPLLHIAGPNTKISGDFGGGNVGGNVVRLEPTSAGSKIRLRVESDSYNNTNLGYPAVEVVSGGGQVDVLPGSNIVGGNSAALSSGNVTFWNEPGSPDIAFNQGVSSKTSTLGWGLNSSPGLFVKAKGDGSNELTAFQNAIDSLPTIGGSLYVQPGNYSWLNPALLTVPTDKTITWYDRGNNLPTGMPGVVKTSGYRMQPGESSNGLSARPGTAYERRIAANHIPNPAQPSQQDSLFYAEGNVPYYVSSNASEFAAYRFNMTSAAFDNVNSPGNLDIKGLQGVVRGVGGNAKVRSIRTGSWGLSGHDGIVTGAMMAACRGGVIPASMGGNGTSTFTSGVAGPYKSGDAAIIGQVGAGIQSVFRAEGFSAKERPQFMFLQANGNQAVLPELATFELHGGGAGDVVRLKKDDIDSTVIQKWNNDGRFSATAYRSNVDSISIADNSVLAIPLPKTHGMFEFWIENSMGAFAKFQYRGLSAGVAGSALAYSGTLVDLLSAGTNLTGAVGVDGRVSVSVYQNTILIENRLGTTRNIGFVFLAV